MRILIVDDEPMARSYLKLAVEQQGHETAEAADGAEGYRLFLDFKPDLTLCDICMPNVDGLNLLGNIREKSPDALVVMFTGLGSEESAINALRLRANYYLQKPVRHGELLHLLRKYEAIVQARNAELQVLGHTLLRHFRIEFDNTMALVPRRAGYLVTQTGDMYNEKQRTGLVLGLVELLVNAIEHGNLGISREEKKSAIEDGFDTYEGLLADRMKQPELANRKVTVDFKQDLRGCEWIIEDEGAGFDWRGFVADLNSEKLFQTHPCGIYLSRSQFDRFAYNEQGNRVTVSKFASDVPLQ
jgi:CheY-like chemotaxis protein/anti-sigma regulatory factor (Ser/Thr protein kinase)